MYWLEWIPHWLLLVPVFIFAALAAGVALYVGIAAVSVVMISVIVLPLVGLKAVLRAGPRLKYRLTHRRPLDPTPRKLAQNRRRWERAERAARKAL